MARRKSITYGLEKQIASIPAVAPQPCNNSLDKFDEGEAGVVLIRTVSQLIKPSIDAINNDTTFPGYRLGDKYITYNREVLQKSLKNYRAILQNLNNIDREKGRKYRAVVARMSPRITETKDFDIKYDNGHGNAIFNKDFLNRILDAANDEKTDMDNLNQIFEKSFWLFLQPHFIESDHLDDWYISETISQANLRIYDTYHR